MSAYVIKYTIYTRDFPQRKCSVVSVVCIFQLFYLGAGWGAIGICALPFRIKRKMSKQTLHTRVITISLRHFPVAEESWKFANILAMPAGHISQEIGN